LDLQAATGLLAVIVLLVIMNWFFHKVYWGGWICLHNKQKKDLLARAERADISRARLWWGLGLLGFASFYREGFEVVLFLQLTARWHRRSERNAGRPFPFWNCGDFNLRASTLFALSKNVGDDGGYCWVASCW